MPGRQGKRTQRTENPAKSPVKVASVKAASVEPTLTSFLQLAVVLCFLRFIVSPVGHSWRDESN